LICHWRGNHWVVLHGRRGSRLLVADPARGLVLLETRDFLNGWEDGILLLLEPDPQRFPPEVARTDAGRQTSLSVIGRYVLPFRRLLLQVFLLNLVIGVMALSMPLLMQILTDDVLVRGDDRMLTSLAITIIRLFVFGALIDLLQGTLVRHFGHKLQLQMLLHYGRHLLELHLGYVENRRSGEVVSRIEDIEQVNKLIGNLVLGLPGQFCIALVSLALMATYNSSLTLAALVGYVLVIAFEWPCCPRCIAAPAGWWCSQRTTRDFWWRSSAPRHC
jgi:ATP-binding cassette subfamily B protein